MTSEEDRKPEEDNNSVYLSILKLHFQKLK